MRIMICDDDERDLRELEKIIAGYYKDSAEIACYTSSSSVMKQLQKGTAPDIVFLDILMPYMKGTVLAKKMRDAGFEGYIVFLTTSNDFATQSYGVNAFSYLLKPASSDELVRILKNIEKAEQREDRACIRIKNKKGLYNLPIRELSHIEIWQHNLIFHLTNTESITVYDSYRNYEAQIEADARLIRCHHSFFVNIKQVTSVVGTEITMRNRKRIPISKKYGDFKMRYMKCLFTEEELI